MPHDEDLVFDEAGRKGRDGWSRALLAGPPSSSRRGTGCEAAGLSDGAAELRGDSAPALARCAALEDGGWRRAGQGAAAEANATPACRGQPHAGAIADEVPLELGDGGEDGHEEAADGVAAGLEVKALGGDDEPHAVNVDELAEVRE